MTVMLIVASASANPNHSTLDRPPCYLPAPMSAVSEPRPATPLAGITRNVVALGVVSLLTDVSSEMIVPVLPLFVTAGLGASAESLGWIEAPAQSAAFLLRIVSGWLSDRIGRRKP